MLFLPKTYERYLAALRNHLQRKLLRQGESAQILSDLKKITLIGLLCREEKPVPTDVCRLCDRILGAAAAELLPRGRFVASFLTRSHARLLQRDLFCALLLELTVCCAGSESGSLHIRHGRQDVRILACGCIPDRAVRLLCRRMRAACLYDRQTCRTAVLIPAASSELPAAPEPDEWHYLLDPLSRIKVFLSSLPPKGAQ